MNTYIVILTANIPVTLDVPGQIFRLMSSAVGTTVDVELMRNNATKAKATGMVAGYWSKPDRDFDRGGQTSDAYAFDAVKLTSANSQTVQIAIGTGDAGLDVVNGSVNATIVLGTAINDQVPVVVGVVATPLLGANAGRRRAIFFNGGTAIVYLGGAAVTVANGALQINPGQAWIETEAPGGAWYGISDTAAQTVRVQEAA